MITPTRMKQLVAVVLEGDVDAVTRSLLDEGVMHFISVRSLAGDDSASLKPVGSPEYAPTAAVIRGRIESLLEVSKVDPSVTRELDVAALTPVDLERASATIASVEGRVAEHKLKISAAEDEIHHLTDIHRQIELYGDLSRGIPESSQYSFLTMQTGALPIGKAESLVNSFAQMPVVTITLRDQGDERNLLLISLKRDEKKIDVILDKHGWHDLDLSSDLANVDQEVIANLDDRITALSETRETIKSEMKESITKRSEELTELWANLRMNELYSRIQSFFSRTARTILFTGWVPKEASANLDTKIRHSCRSGCYLEWHDPPEDDEGTNVPVQLENPGFLKPFEMLVKNYAVPSYGSIDPTPLVAIAYLIMFGLMFGDAGHGLILILIGLLGKLVYKKKNNVRHLLTLLTYCGGASIITGVLFGSYFGFRWFKPLWFDFHGIVSGHSGGNLVSSIYDVLGVTIYFGISVIGLGIIINLINLVRKRHWFEFVFDKAGLIGGFIYGSGVWATRYFIETSYKQLPPGNLLFFLLGIPVILLAFKAPLRHVLTRSSGTGHRLHAMSIVDFLMDWIVEVLEIFSGYLANTLSFMRVAGLGIAHEALLIAFFQIAGMTGNGSLANIWAVLILIIGNVLIIAMEGLSAGIQSLRLNYYEFFSKYFTGTGRRYEPVSLRMKN
jgi:V/A-type H+/Na+-transporting ATPase subunit I